MTCPVSSAAAYRAGRTDGPLRCTWTPEAGAPGASPSPHTRYRPVRPKIGETILDFVGETPMVRARGAVPSAGCEAGG